MLSKTLDQRNLQCLIAPYLTVFYVTTGQADTYRYTQAEKKKISFLSSRLNRKIRRVTLINIFTKNIFIYIKILNYNNFIIFHLSVKDTKLFAYFFFTFTMKQSKALVVRYTNIVVSIKMLKISNKNTATLSSARDIGRYEKLKIE
ncbi:hypothetical protein [Bartonella tribocorum]|uniref:Uncharacterized protein n=1 Tax=Bartonella tribocorum TaxID=85701 RepID=A0A2M6UXZ0_9HYPH|nr:hypothetical protein [Bartonella tribocorum]PIT71062.1 hypothetical protein CEV08_00385 [Bartonella tribocorum]